MALGSHHKISRDYLIFRVDGSDRISSLLVMRVAEHFDLLSR